MLVLASPVSWSAGAATLTPPPAVEAAPLSVGAVEVVGDTTWRWVGPNDCTTDTDIIQLQRRSGDGEWSGARIPLVTVLGITFSDSGDERRRVRHLVVVYA